MCCCGCGVGLADWAATPPGQTADAPLDSALSSPPTLTPVNAVASHPRQNTAGLFAFLIRLAGGVVAPMKA